MGGGLASRGLDPHAPRRRPGAPSWWQSWVHSEVRDGALLDAPFLERRLVATIGIHLVERLDDGFAKLGLVFGNDHAVRGSLVDVTHSLEFPVRLFRGVRDNR